MLTLVTKEFTFDAAHFLTKYYGKCEKMHGHTYKLHVTVKGPISENGLVLDFVLLKKIVKERILSKLDHSLLNDLFPNPSSEHIAQWIWQELEPLTSLLQEELNHPNLSQEIKQYLQDEAEADLNQAKISNMLELYEIKLWETPTSFVTIRQD